jgi:fumarate hydratase class II
MKPPRSVPEAPQHLPEHPEVLSEAERAKSRKEDETVSLGRTFIRDADKANAFSKLSRYEAGIERSLYRALHELQRLQAARRAVADVPPPAVVDVDVSGVSGEDL